MGYQGWSYESAFAPHAWSAADAREFVREHLLRHHLSYLVDDIRLVVSELATNAMVHAQTPFTVTLAERDRSILLTVRDGSFESPAQLTASLMDTGGRGMHVVDQVSSSWGVITPDGAGHSKAVWASFDTGPVTVSRR